MLRTIVLLAVTATLLLPMAGAVVGHNSSNDDGDMHIMSSGSSASATTAVGENGTEYTAKVEQQAASCMNGNQSAGVSDISFNGDDSMDGKNSVTFTGLIQTATPCYTVDHNVEKTGKNTYVLNVTTEATGDMCVECVGAVTYDTEFVAQEPFNLTVKHDGEDVETVTHPGFDGDEPANQSFWAGILGLFSLFF